MEAGKKKKLATLVGCNNYAGTLSELQGCINDESTTSTPCAPSSWRSAGRCRPCWRRTRRGDADEQPYREVVPRAREVLGKQVPAAPLPLYCSDANAGAPFLGQQETRAKSN
jgi:hypothetical protein